MTTVPVFSQGHRSVLDSSCEQTDAEQVAKQASRNVVIISNRSGSGHQQTANILAQTLRKQGWSVEIISIYQDIFAAYAQPWGIDLEMIYNRWVLMREMTGGLYRLFFILTHYGLVQPNRKRFAACLVQLWQRKQPDMIISLIPVVNQTVAQSAERANIPFVIVQTDLFEFHERFWLTPVGTWFVADKTTYTVVGTQMAYEQVRTMFVDDPARVFQLSGNIIAQHFLEPPSQNRARERQRLGLDADTPTGIFLYGGFAPNRLLTLAKALNRLGDSVQYVFICGHNERLYHQLRALPTTYRKVVLGYSQDVPLYMHLADFLVGKSGPGTIMEAIAVGLPVLIDVRKTLIHERHNAAWVEQQGYGQRFRSPAELLVHIQQLVRQPWRVHFDNRAVLEIVPVLEHIHHDFNHRQSISARPS